MAKFYKTQPFFCIRYNRKVLQIIDLQDFIFIVPLDVLFSNEFLRDLSRLWELRTIVPDPSNPTLVML